MDEKKNVAASLLRRSVRAMKLRKAFLTDFFNLGQGLALDNQVHMKYTADWLAVAQDATLDDGVSALFSISHGWDVSYPETTGYIIPTFLNYSRFAGQGIWRDRAIKMADWLLMRQLDSGGFPHKLEVDTPVVFDTGQIIFGLISVFRETRVEEYLHSAERAARWLASIQESTGAWTRFNYRGSSHVYDTLVSWSLLEVYRDRQDYAFLNASKRHLVWALNHQLENGWFQDNAFSLDESPSLHTIAYAARGFLEAGIILRCEEYIQAAIRAADMLLAKQKGDGSLHGEYDENWRSTVRWTCLTGNAQTAIIWLKLYLMNGNLGYFEAAKRANSFIKKTQNIKTNDLNIRGGIKGSHPIYGGYSSYAYPNWAAKFFLDSLMLEETVRLQLGWKSMSSVG